MTQTELLLIILGTLTDAVHRTGPETSSAEKSNVRQLVTALEQALGKPAPLGLWHADGDPNRPGDHQVLAVGYDMGTWVADVGYRGLYIHQVNNAPTDTGTDSGPTP